MHTLSQLSLRNKRIHCLKNYDTLSFQKALWNEFFPLKAKNPTKIQTYKALKIIQHRETPPPPLPCTGSTGTSPPPPNPPPSQLLEARKCHFQSPLLCLEVGSRQLWGHWPSPNVDSHWEGLRSVTPRDQRLCFLLLLNQLQAWSPGYSRSRHGSDDREQPNAVRGPQRGCVQPRKRSSLLDSKIQEVWGTRANDARKSADRWFSSIPGARNYKNKTGKKSLNKDFISKFSRTYFLFSFLKSRLGYKIQVCVLVVK